jgi:hypothetical protein
LYDLAVAHGGLQGVAVEGAGALGYFMQQKPDKSTGADLGI